VSDVLHRMIALARELGELEKKLSDRDLTALRKLLNRAPVFPATALLLALDYLHGESCGTCSTERDQLHSFIVDAIVPGSALTLELASELDRMAPFGLGNPDVNLLVPSCEAVDPSLVGEGKHVRFRVRHLGRDAGSAIAFGFGGQLDRLRREARYDLVFRLKENRWNGTIAPQLVVRRLLDAPDGYEELRNRLAALWREGEGSWTPEARAIFTELELELAQGKRQLLESETFRALLERRDALPRAA